MTSVPTEDLPVAQGPAALAQTYARIAGILFLISLVAGGFGEFYVPSKLIVSSDATATAQNILASFSLFRLGFAAYLIEAVCDIGLTLMLYILLRPVSNHLALLAVFFRIMGTALFAVAELFYFAAAPILGGADYLKTFSPDQLNSVALLSLRLYGYAAGIFMVFYGVASILLGFLMFRSGYLPKFLGVLFALSGAGLVIRNFTLVLAPAYASFFLLLPTMIAGLSMTFWLLAKGIDASKWAAHAATGDASL